MKFRTDGNSALAAGDQRSTRLMVSRRSIVAAFLSLAAYLHLLRPAAASRDKDSQETVLAGRWLLKRGEIR